MWIQILRNNSPVMSGVMYLPLAATHLFTCLFVLPVIFWRMGRLRLEVHQNKTSSGPGTVKPAQKVDTEKQDSQPSLTHIHANFHKDDSSSPVYILVASLSTMALCAGISSTFNPSTPLATMLGLQTLFSISVGLGASQSALFGLNWSAMLSPPPSISQEENRMQPNLAIFAEMVGGSIGTTAAQAILTHLLRHQDLDLVLRGGITNIRESSSGEALERALAVINTAMTRTFFVATAAGALPVGIPVALGAALLAIAVTPFGWCFAYLWWRRNSWARPEAMSFPEVPGEREASRPLPPDLYQAVTPPSPTKSNWRKSKEYEWATPKAT
jgi:hypothetical protein